MDERSVEPSVRLSCVIGGRVQGVGFRWYVREQARALGVRGTVCNRDDGTVEVHAAGEAAAIMAFRSLLFSGPPGASVTQLDEIAPAPDALSTPFAILR